jgi:hypothetical protein
MQSPAKSATFSENAPSSSPIRSILRNSSTPRNTEIYNGNVIDDSQMTLRLRSGPKMQRDLSAQPTTSCCDHSACQPATLIGELNELLKGLTESVQQGGKYYESYIQGMTVLVESMGHLGVKINHLTPVLESVDKKLGEHAAFLEGPGLEGKREMKQMVLNLGGATGELSKISGNLSGVVNSLQIICTERCKQHPVDVHLAKVLAQFSGDCISKAIEAAIGNMTAQGKFVPEAVEEARTQAKVALYNYQQISQSQGSTTEQQIAKYLESKLDEDDRGDDVELDENGEPGDDDELGGNGEPGGNEEPGDHGEHDSAVTQAVNTGGCGAVC